MNLGKINSKWPKWLRPLRSRASWANSGRRFADEMNEGFAQISILDPAKAMAMALELASFTRLMRVQTPEERTWRKEVLAMLANQGSTSQGKKDEVAAPRGPDRRRSSPLVLTWFCGEMRARDVG